MTTSLVLQVAYSTLGLFFASASVRLYGHWARRGGRSKLVLAFILTCLTVDSLCDLIQMVAVQPNRWLVGLLLTCGALLIGLATTRTWDSLRQSGYLEQSDLPPLRTHRDNVPMDSSD
ncbi:MAG: hypothetical protein VX346_23155 [Planctomycetota bacterium]|nr:hypothetical protein [Planctomycetota bacterium]